MKRIEQRSADIPVRGSWGLSRRKFQTITRNTDLESSVNPHTGMSALRGRATGATPLPIFRAHAQARIHRVHGRVTATAMHVLVIANEVVKRLRLPKLLSCQMQEFIRFSRRVSLPVLQNLAQRPTRQRM